MQRRRWLLFDVNLHIHSARIKNRKKNTKYNVTYGLNIRFLNFTTVLCTNCEWIKTNLKPKTKLFYKKKIRIGIVRLNL